MPKKYIRKLQRIGSHSYYLNVPKRLIKLFGWKERQRLELKFGGRKEKLVVRDFDPKKKQKW